MKRDELEELHFITPIANVPSMLQRGILSYDRARRVHHESVALSEVQHRRAAVTVPGGRPLHRYANLYLCARNPMLYRRQEQHESLCVLRVSTDVLDLAGVVITDQNAASDYVRFAPAPDGLEHVDGARVFAQSWVQSDDPIQRWRDKSIKCAEVLVPDLVEPRFIKGVYVSGKAASEALHESGVALPVTISGHLFFR